MYDEKAHIVLISDKLTHKPPEAATAQVNAKEGRKRNDWREGLGPSAVIQVMSQP